MQHQSHHTPQNQKAPYWGMTFHVLWNWCLGLAEKSELIPGSAEITETQGSTDHVHNFQAPHHSVNYWHYVDKPSTSSECRACGTPCCPPERQNSIPSPSRMRQITTRPHYAQNAGLNVPVQGQADDGDVWGQEREEE